MERYKLANTHLTKKLKSTPKKGLDDYKTFIKKYNKDDTKNLKKIVKNLTKDKDVHHKDNNPENNDKSNLSIVSQNYNRKEPRLRERLVKQGILKNGKRK